MKKKVLILGGGLAGLAAGFFLARMGIDFVLLEAGETPGGTLALGEEGGFRFDAGIHVLHTRRPEILDLLQNELQIPLERIRRRAFFVHDDRVIPYPFQVHTYCLSLLERIRILAELCFTAQKKTASYANYEEYLFRNFGPTLSRRFFIPYAEKFWTVSPREMTAEWTAGRVPLPPLRDRVRGLWTGVQGDYGPNAGFFYPRRGGIASLGEALASRLRGHLRTGTRVSGVDLHSRAVTCADGRRYFFEQCISTIPLPFLAAMLHPPSRELQGITSRLRHTAILCISAGFQGSLPHDFHWVYFPSSAEPMARVHFPGNISAGNVPPGCCSLQAEVVFRGPALRREVDASFVEACLKRLETLGLVKSLKKILFLKLDWIDPAYVIFDHFRRDNLPGVLRMLERQAVIPAGRFGCWGYHWMHDSLESGGLAARKAAGSLAE